MTRRYAMAGALLAVALMSHGCAHAPHRSRLHAHAAHTALVLPPEPLLERGAESTPPFAAPWEFGRNDAAINYQPFGAAQPWGWTETYTRDRFHTFGGHTHEHSRYEIRSYRIR